MQVKALGNNLPYGDTFIKDSTDIANEFNDFLVNVASKLKNPLTNNNHTKLKEFCQAKLPKEAKFIHQFKKKML